VVLTGVDLTSWGTDLPGAAAARRSGDAHPEAGARPPRLRISSIDSIEADENLMQAIATEPRLMPHLHLSLQHGDNLILKRMKRRHSCAKTRSLHRGGPRSCGPTSPSAPTSSPAFPTETEAHFEQSLKLVEDCGLTWLHVFPYSPARHPRRADADAAFRRGRVRQRSARRRHRRGAHPGRRGSQAAGGLMHPNPAFRGVAEARAAAFARDRGFGTLAVNGPAGPLLSHVPFLLSADGATAELHLLRSNPIARALAAPLPAVMAVTGPEGYVSPDWYGMPDQVPTWNYVAVHLRGTLESLPEDALAPMLDRLSAWFEARLAPKPAWTSDKMAKGVMARMMRAIAPCRLTVDRIDSTWKLNQNKPAAARLGAAAQVADPALAALMRDPPDHWPDG
jgi:transcriptional regulator